MWASEYLEGTFRVRGKIEIWDLLKEWRKRGVVGKEIERCVMACVARCSNMFEWGTNWCLHVCDCGFH